MFHFKYSLFLELFNENSIRNVMPEILSYHKKSTRRKFILTDSFETLRFHIEQLYSRRVQLAHDYLASAGVVASHRQRNKFYWYTTFTRSLHARSTNAVLNNKEIIWIQEMSHRTDVWHATMLLNLLYKRRQECFRLRDNAESR